MVRLILFTLLLVVPIVEIAIFLTVGGAIGVLPTIALILLTAVIGATLLKRQGAEALRRLQSDMNQARVPAAAIGHAITVAIAGALLLTPGFMTDALGFLLFIPAVRSALWRQIRSSVKVHRFGGQPGGQDPFGPQGPRPANDPFGGPTGPRSGSGRGPTIDLDPDEVTHPDDTSPWRAGDTPPRG